MINPASLALNSAPMSGLETRLYYEYYDKSNRSTPISYAAGGLPVPNTCTPTVLQAGSKTNVIPSTAEVHLDCRKLPGQSVEDVIREIKERTRHACC